MEKIKPKDINTVDKSNEFSEAKKENDATKAESIKQIKQYDMKKSSGWFIITIMIVAVFIGLIVLIVDKTILSENKTDSQKHIREKGEFHCEHMNGINGRISFTCHHPSLNERLYHLLVT
ncbi:uncharacterized protein LOC144619016 isoform X2 [Crassostrea virginica]